MTTIPDHVGREAVRLLNEQSPHFDWRWPEHSMQAVVITVAKLLMNPPAPMTDPDEEAAKRVMDATFGKTHWPTCPNILAKATEQMRKEREAWEAGR